MPKIVFPISESKHVTIISSMLPYCLSHREYLIKDIRSNISNIHINVNIPHIDICFHVQRSTYTICSYFVVNPSGQNWADKACIAPTLHANNLFEIGVDSEENCLLILLDKEATTPEEVTSNFFSYFSTLYCRRPTFNPFVLTLLMQESRFANLDATPSDEEILKAIRKVNAFSSWF